MTSFSDQIRQAWDQLWDGMQHTTREVPATVRILPANSSGGNRQTAPLEANQHYVQIVVNELYLASSRQWLTVVDPTVLVVAELLYDRAPRTVPAIVGPAQLQQTLQQIPNGMLFQDTRVVGPHPYRGGRLALSVVLCQAKREDYVRRMLKLVEQAGALGSILQLSSYLKVAELVLSGVEQLFSSQDLTALVGLRTEFNPDAGTPLTPGFYALINAPERQIDPAKLWVRDNRLLVGDSLAAAQPFRAADYVLYSVVASTTCNEVALQVFGAQLDQAKQDMGRGDDAGKESAKITMKALWQAMALSPDLTVPDRNRLQAQYRQELIDIYTAVNSIATLSGEPQGVLPPITDPDAAEAEANRLEAVAILDL